MSDHRRQDQRSMAALVRLRTAERSARRSELIEAMAARNRHQARQLAVAAARAEADREAETHARPGRLDLARRAACQRSRARLAAEAATLVGEAERFEKRVADGRTRLLAADRALRALEKRAALRKAEINATRARRAARRHDERLAGHSGAGAATITREGS